MAAQTYADISPELGNRFSTVLERLIAEIREHPRVFRVFDPPARRHFGTEFPYAIIYLDRSDEIWIVAVAHFKQRPDYWKERLR